jgi:hypothetical protein
MHPRGMNTFLHFEDKIQTIPALMQLIQKLLDRFGLIVVNTSNGKTISRDV